MKDDILGAENEEEKKEEHPVPPNADKVEFSMMQTLLMAVEALIIGAPGDRKKDPFVTGTWKMAFGLDIAYEVLKSNNFPTFILNLLYVSIWTVLFFFRSVKNELIWFLLSMIIFGVGLSALGFVCCFMGLLCNGMGVYQ